MNHDIKKLAEAVESDFAKKLIETHVKELHFANGHLIIYVDNAHPLHELNDKKMEHHFKVGIGKIYGEEMTYEFKLHNSSKPNEEEKKVGRSHDFNLMHDQKAGKK